MKYICRIALPRNILPIPPVVKPRRGKTPLARRNIMRQHHKVAMAVVGKEALITEVEGTIITVGTSGDISVVMATMEVAETIVAEAAVELVISCEEENDERRI
jgi:hypothetical protein